MTMFAAHHEPEPDELPPVSRSLDRAIGQLATLRRELSLEVHLASSDARESFRKLEPELRDLDRYRDGSEHSVECVRELLRRAAALYERVRQVR